jgi:hypothetical protein
MIWGRIERKAPVMNRIELATTAEFDFVGLVNWPLKVRGVERTDS